MSPAIIQSFLPVEVQEGETAKFECRVFGKPAPEVEWYKDDQFLDESDRVKFENKDGVCTLTINDTSAFDEAEYKVLARNPLGTATCTAELLVEESVSKPELIQPMENMVIKPGEDGCFRVLVKGDVKVDWYKNDKLLEDEGRVVIVDEDDGETFTLAMEEATVEDSGVYKCVASNKAGEVTCSASLKVTLPSQEATMPRKEPRPRKISEENRLKRRSLSSSSLSESPDAPYFDEPQKDIVYDVSEGDVVGFNLSVHGTPEPTIEWFKDDEKLNDGKSCRITKDGGKHLLKLEKITLEDSGIYKCFATNENGTEERIFQLDVEGMCFMLIIIIKVMITITVTITITITMTITMTVTMTITMTMTTIIIIIMMMMVMVMMMTMMMMMMMTTMTMMMMTITMTTIIIRATSL